MSVFKYQMHCHTAPCSGCGRITPYELVHSLKNAGYSGAVLTNHFYNGNTGIDKKLSWKKFVSFYEKDYLECKSFAEPLGIDILFGVEEHIGNGQEILCYGLTPEMLYAHRELKENNLEIWYNTLSSLGVVIIQAHPYRARNYVSEVGILPLDFIDGIEVFNFGNSPEENLSAQVFMKNNGNLIFTSGADAHLPHTLGRAGIISDYRIDSPDKLVSTLKNGTFTLLRE